MEIRTKGKGTIDHRLQRSMGMLVDANPTKLSKQSQGCPLTDANPSVTTVTNLDIWQKIADNQKRRRNHKDVSSMAKKDILP